MNDIQNAELSAMSAIDFIELVHDAVVNGRAPVVRMRYKDGTPVNLGFHLVPDYSSICAACKGKVN